MRAIFSVLNTPAVAGIVGAKIWQDQAEQSAQAPFIVWSRLIAPINGLGYSPCIDRETITVDVMGKDEAQRDALLAAVRNAIEPVGMIGTIQSLGKDPGTQIWRYTLDADIFASR